MYYIYILKCDDNSYYTGVTNNLERRLLEHKEGLYGYTSERLPLKLVYYEEFKYILNAIEREKQIKRWSRKKKEALIGGNELALRKAARTAQHYDIPL